MSTSDLYILNKKSVTHFDEFHNGWGSGPACWEHLGEKYLGAKPSIFDRDIMDRVWKLAAVERVQHHEKVALKMTFDKAYVPLNKLEDAAAACEKFGKETWHEGHVNHWPAFGEALKRASQMKLSRHARGICLSCTSVCDEWEFSNQDWIKNAWSIYD